MNTVKDIRRENLRYIVNTRYNGVVNRLAKDVGMHQAQVARVFVNGSTRRDMSDKMARALEEKIGLERGWLDQEHAKVDDLSARFSQLSLEQRRVVSDLLNHLLQQK